MPPTTRYAVYADLPRPLTEREQYAIFDALEGNVPNSGCVGSQKGPNAEVYFSIEAHSEVAADAQAVGYMNLVLEAARVNVEYTIKLQKM